MKFKSGYRALATVGIAASALILLGAVRQQPAAEAPPQPPAPAAEPCVAGVALLGWMTGDWSHTDESGVWEERWSPPLSGCIVGSLRWVRGGKPAMYEMLAIEEDEQGHVRMFVRHFNAGLKPWAKEDGNPTPTWVLTSVERGRAVFEDPAIGFPAKMTYTGDFENGRSTALKVRLEGVENGAVRLIDFEFRPIEREGGDDE